MHAENQGQHENQTQRLRFKKFNADFEPAGHRPLPRQVRELQVGRKQSRVLVESTRIGDLPFPAKPAKPKVVNRYAGKKQKPRTPLAITSAYYATIVDGRRVVRFYYSGEPLEGRTQ